MGGIFAGMRKLHDSELRDIELGYFLAELRPDTDYGAEQARKDVGRLLEALEAATEDAEAKVDREEYEDALRDAKEVEEEKDLYEEWLPRLHARMAADPLVCACLLDGDAEREQLRLLTVVCLVEPLVALLQRAHLAWQVAERAKYGPEARGQRRRRA